jgi:DNA-binding transcriptional MerR regulator
MCSLLDLLAQIHGRSDCDSDIIRRFRELDMPLSGIRAVLTTPDLQARNELIVDHLNRLEIHLARTQGVVASLRDLL